MNFPPLAAVQSRSSPDPPTADPAEGSLSLNPPVEGRAPPMGGLPLPRAGEAGADGANLLPRTSPQSRPESTGVDGPLLDIPPPGPPRPGRSARGPERVQSPADRPSSLPLADRCNSMSFSICQASYVRV